MSAFSSGSDGSCSTWEVVTSSGLFLGSALLFQWLQRRGRLIYLAEELENERTSLDLECYMKRRMEDRLSFHELDDKLVSSSDDDGSSAGSFDGDFRASAQQEVHPTNNNWNHFEGYGCDDEEMEVKKLRKRKEKKAPKANLIRGSSFCSDCEEILEKMLEGDDLKEVDVVRLHSSDKISSFGEFLKRGRTISDGSKFNLPTLSALKSLEQSTLALPARRSPSVTQVNGILRNSTSLDAHGLSKGTKSEHHTALKRRSISFTDRHTSINGELSHVRKHSTQVRHENRAARTKYNASIMPNKLILIRHGQTLGNIDECLYATTPDNAMPLTELGWEQAREAGKQLKHIMSNSSKGEGIHFILSPYVRTVETFHGIASAWCEPSEFSHISDREQRLKAWYGRLLELGITWHEDPRIREQDFGNYQEPEKIKQAKIDRHRFGAFYYRFPHGESASDVFDRVSTFLDSLWRSFDTNDSRNYVLITHGISIRVILARYFRYTISQFHLLANPRNCEMVWLGHDGAGRLELVGRYELDVTERENSSTPRVLGYKFYKRLRVLPQKSIRKVNIRMCFASKKLSKGVDLSYPCFVFK